MAGIDWTQYAVGGATRPDSFSGMQPEFSSALANLFASAPENVRSGLRVGSGFRSPQRQEQLWQQALQKYGSESAARKWVAPPGRSQHNHGNAADLKYLNDAARQWVHQNAGQFGLAFPLSNENWHIELAGARGGHKHGAAPMMAAAKSGAIDPVGEVMAAGAPQAASPLAAMFSGPGAAPAAGAPAASPGIGSIALMFAQQQAQRQQQRADEEAADQARRNALFGADSLAGLYG